MRWWIHRFHMLLTKLMTNLDIFWRCFPNLTDWRWWSDHQQTSLNRMNEQRFIPTFASCRFVSDLTMPFIFIGLKPISFLRKVHFVFIHQFWFAVCASRKATRWKWFVLILSNPMRRDYSLLILIQMNWTVKDFLWSFNQCHHSFHKGLIER